MSELRITLEDLFELSGSVIYNPDDYEEASRVYIDSRKVTSDSIYIAIAGERFDGHDFVKESINKRVKAVVIDEKKLSSFDEVDSTIVTVPDTEKAFGELATIWRKKLSCKVISITGSNGKTSTKEYLGTILESKYNVGKTLANNNNHLGVPLTIFSADERCEALILEHGTNHFGEIEYTAKIAQPDYAVMTNIGDSHLEFLIDREGVWKEKRTLLDITSAKGGMVFLNSDDPILEEKKSEFDKVVSVGFSNNPDYKGEITGCDEFGRTTLRVTIGMQSKEYVLPVHGKVAAKNILMAIAIAKEIGLEPEVLEDAILKVKPAKGRLNYIEIKNSLIIDDTYNANPESVREALILMDDITAYSRKILVLGDMFELGENKIVAHAKLSEQIRAKAFSCIWLIGDLMKNLHMSLQKNEIKSEYFSDREELKKEYANVIMMIRLFW